MRCSLFRNIADVYHLLLRCWAVPFFETLLMYTLAFYISVKFPTLKLWWRDTCLFYFVVLFTILKQWWGRSYLITLLRSSHFWSIADVNPVLLRCCPVPTVKALLRHILPYYTADKFSFLEHCWRKTCLVPMMRSSNFRNIADVYRVLLQCWALPSNKNLLRCTLSFYISEKFPILKHWWRITCLVTVLSCSHFWNFANINLIFLLCWVVPTFESLLT